MVVATILWGATFIMVRDTLRDLPPLSLMAIRFGFASIVWGLVLIVRRALGHRVSGGRKALIAGLASTPFTAGGYAFQTIGLTATSAGSSAFLTCTGTLMAAFFAWPLLGIRPGRTLLVGIALAAVGSALLSLRGDLMLGRGEAWTLLGALIYSLQIVIVAPWAAGGADPWIMVAVQTVGTALIALPLAHGLPAQLAGFDATTWWRLGYLVLAGAVVAPLLQVMSQRSLAPGRIALLFALEPVFALIFALYPGGESFVPRWWVGAALILAGVISVEARSGSEPGSSSRLASE
jgi:drug/metabolite transporter (DMT)-like permease